MKTEKEIVIKKVVIQLGDRELILTPEEVSKLQKVLNETFPVERNQSLPMLVPQPYPVIIRGHDWVWNPNIVWCSQNTSGIVNTYGMNKRGQLTIDTSVLS